MTMRLELGPLDILADRPAGRNDWYIEALGAGSTLGNPIPIHIALESFLADGALVVTEGHENREPSFQLRIHAPYSGSLPKAEAALFTECSKPTELRYTPPDGMGETTIFEVVAAKLEHDWDDFNETQLVRAYTVALIAAPFGKSPDETVVVGLASDATPTTTVVNLCDTNTGWTYLSDATDTTPEAATASGGQIRGSLNAHYPFAGPIGGNPPPPDAHYVARGSLVYEPAAPVDMTGFTYFFVDWDASFNGYTPDSPRVVADGLKLAHLATYAIGVPYRRSVYLCPDTSVAAFRIYAPQRLYTYGTLGDPLPGDFIINQIGKSNVSPSTSTERQKVRTIAVDGSARAPGSLAIEHATSALGDVLACTYSDRGDGYTPDMRRWLSVAGGTVTADASLLSGSFNLWTGTVFAAPLRMLQPTSYLVVARVRRPAGTGSVTLTASLDGAATSALVDFTGTGWKTETLGAVAVADHLENTALTTTLTLSDGTGIDVDDVWLVREDARLTQVSLGTDAPSAVGPSNRLWINSPTLARPWPSLWRGTAADRSDARVVVDATAAEQHMFTPSAVTMFLAASNALAPTVSLRYHPRWFTHNAGSVLD